MDLKIQNIKYQFTNTEKLDVGNRLDMNYENLTSNQYLKSISRNKNSLNCLKFIPSKYSQSCHLKYLPKVSAGSQSLIHQICLHKTKFVCLEKF